jgi:hypothetical protein
VLESKFMYLIDHRVDLLTTFNSVNPGTIIQDFGLQQTDPETLDYSNFAKWIPRFSLPQSPCEYCTSRHLECWFTYEGQTGCSACLALFRTCSFTSHDGHRPQMLMDTLHVVQEDIVQSTGQLTGAKALRSWDRTPMDHPSSAQGEDRPTRRSTGTRFSREALKVLKSWVEQHAERPYPSEDEKDELAELTGLSSGQISNWFANTRRRNKRKPTRGVSPSTRSPTWAGGPSAAIPIPASKRGVVQDGKTWDVMNPLERWKASPPENEPAAVDAIAQAVASSRLSSNDSSLSRSTSRRQPTSSAGSGSQSIQRAPSVTSCETGQTDSRKSSESFSNHSLGSSRSHGSRNSLHSYGSGHKKDRRRRKRNALTASRTQAASEHRPFQCTFCTDTFRTKYDWTRHEKSLHLSLEKWICAPLGDVITDPTTGERVCVYCEEKNPSAEHLETHGHSQCEEKGMDSRTFYRKDHLRQHLRLVHGVPMIKSMDSWKSEATYIKCRCGFCRQEFTSWTERCDHIAKHFRNGAKMKDWRGCRGFDAEVSVFVTNSMPPFLIGNEATSLNPFSASDKASLGIHNSNNTCATAGPSLQDQAYDNLQDWNQKFDCHGDLIQDRAIVELGPFDPSEGMTFSMDEPTQAILATGYKPQSSIRISTCWEILTVRLGRYVKEQMEAGILPTDEMLQQQARWILYESDDAWNQTAADNREWLELFKKAHGLPSKATDTWIDWTEDLGGGIGDLSFEGLTFDDAPYTFPISTDGSGAITTEGTAALGSMGVLGYTREFWRSTPEM